VSNIANELEYYIARKPTSDEIAQADEWLLDNPGGDLSEYVSAMIEIGAL
jgi:hypothetical protein